MAGNAASKLSSGAIACVAVTLLTTLGSPAAQAEDGPFDYTVSMWVGAFFAGADGELRWDTRVLPGTELGWEGTLGMDDNETAFNVELGWRFFNRHELSLRYFEVTRNGDTDSPIQFVVNGRTIPVNTRVESQFDAQVIAAHYEFAFIKRDRLMVQIGLGLSVQDLEFAIEAADVPVQEFGDVTAPLPTITLGLDWALSPKWVFALDLGWFDVKIDNIKGEILEARAGIQWQPWKHVGFNIAYDYFDVRGTVTKQEGNFRGKIGYEFYGPMVGVFAHF